VTDKQQHCKAAAALQAAHCHGFEARGRLQQQLLTSALCFEGKAPHTSYAAMIAQRASGPFLDCCGIAGNMLLSMAGCRTDLGDFSSLEVLPAQHNACCVFCLSCFWLVVVYILFVWFRQVFGVGACIAQLT
jgi:hypothetical protein